MYKGLYALLVACSFYSSMPHAEGLSAGTPVSSGLCQLATIRHPGELPTGASISIGSGSRKTTLTRIDYRDWNMVTFGVQSGAMLLSEQGAAFDNLLGQWIRQCPLPDHFEVRFGGTRVALIKELQKRLMQPGANWNLAKGQPLRGNFGSVLSNELTVILTQSPIGMAFAHHGYKLYVYGLEHIEEEPKEFPRTGARVPTDILLMAIVAYRSQKP